MKCSSYNHIKKKRYDSFVMLKKGGSENWWKTVKFFLKEVLPHPCWTCSQWWFPTASIISITSHTPPAISRYSTNDSDIIFHKITSAAHLHRPIWSTRAFIGEDSTASENVRKLSVIKNGCYYITRIEVRGFTMPSI